jgi:hypothetical protein
MVPLSQRTSDSFDRIALSDAPARGRDKAKGHRKGQLLNTYTRLQFNWVRFGGDNRHSTQLDRNPGTTSSTRVSTWVSDEFVMPSAFPGRNSPLPGFASALGITIPSMSMRKDFSVIRSSKFHLRQVDESYFEHLRAASGIAFRLAVASTSCALHAVIPGLCTRSASRRVAAVHAHLSRRNDACEQLRHMSTQCRCGPPAHVHIEDC